MADVMAASEHYDLIVIGGGSGGLACSKRAVAYGKKVAVLDFVKPSPMGSQWGLGGTCVNVGCIPKKLFHTAALLHDHINDSKDYGWSETKVQHDWSELTTNIQAHIRSLNWNYRTQLREKKVKYYNRLGSFMSNKEIETVDKDGVVEKLSADHFVVAVGGRPRQLSIPGGEYAITSDDIFSHQNSPGKTLCVGASYISLECAGFMAGLGLDVTVMVRSILLRGFDRQMADKVGEGLEAHGVKFIHTTVPERIVKLDSGKLQVHFKNKTTGEEGKEEFDTVLAAIGRNADTDKLNCAAAGVNLARNGKIIGDNGYAEQSSQRNIYAIGDCLNGYPELTPVAIQAGKMLADRMFGNSRLAMDYVFVPTTVFTPVEYGACGFSEEDAEEKFGGANNLIVYHKEFTPLEYTLPHRNEKIKCYMKLICNKAQRERVVGFHYYGPNAGEVSQGFGLSMKLGATKADFETIVGIHPTCAEGFTTMEVSKESGVEAEDDGC